MRRQFRLIAAVLAVLIVVSVMPLSSKVNAATAKDLFEKDGFAHSKEYYNGIECEVGIFVSSDKTVYFRCDYRTDLREFIEFEIDLNTNSVINNLIMAKIGWDKNTYKWAINAHAILKNDYNPEESKFYYNYQIPSGFVYTTEDQVDAHLKEYTEASINLINSALIKLYNLSLGDLGFSNFEALNNQVPSYTAHDGTKVKVDLSSVEFDEEFRKTTLYGMNFEYRIYNSPSYNTLYLTGNFTDDNSVVEASIRTTGSTYVSDVYIKYFSSTYGFTQYLYSILPLEYNPKTTEFYFSNDMTSINRFSTYEEMHNESNLKAKALFEACESILKEKGFDYTDLGLDNYYATPTPTPIPTKAPTKAPTATPKPTKAPTAIPTKAPAVTTAPTKAPATVAPTKAPGTTSAPKPTVKPTAVPSKTPTSSPAPSTPSAPADNGVGGFIDRLYTVALDRDFDEGGKNYWTNEIKVNGQTGADIARQFLYSEEFLGKNMSQDDFLTVLYRTFFDREPDADGLKFWKDQMSAGQTKEWVIAGFINSEEWANICLSFGIRSGSSVAPTITIVPNEQVIGFATRLYTTCLKRDFDPEGLDFWAKELANLRRTGSEAAKGFFFSDELNKSGISDSEFLTRLYKTLMNREPEKEGFDYWLGQMKSGAMSRESVFDGFAASEEWVGICADYGILR